MKAKAEQMLEMMIPELHVFFSFHNVTAVSG